MDGNTEGRRLRQEAAAFSFGASGGVRIDQRLMVSFSIFWVISSKAPDSSAPLAAS